MSPIMLLPCQSHLALGVGYANAFFASFLLYFKFEVGIYIKKNKNTEALYGIVLFKKSKCVLT